VERPDPYNRGTDMADVPLARTYKDDMRYGYIDELQQYMAVPLSSFAVRVFYNRDLLKRLTGRDTAPTDYRDFLAVCRQIAAQKDESGRFYTPIAASGTFHFQYWEQLMFDAPTYGALRFIDFDRDGYHTPDEFYLGIKTGKIGLDFDGYRAKFKMVQEVTKYFQSGYIGLSRDEAVFLFAQGKAVFVPTGTWDARSLQAQSEGRFRVGITNFPVPSRDDPEFGRFIEGPVYDQPMTGIEFAVSRTCKHQDVAIDFLRYIASKRENEKFNRIVGWIPVIRNTKLDPFLAAFEPHLYGTFSVMDATLSGETSIRWTQLRTLFQAGQISYDEFAKQYTDFEMKRGPRAFDELAREWQRAYQIDEGIAASMRARALLGPPAEAPQAWVKYRSLLETQQIRLAIDHERKEALLRGIGVDDPAPYEIRPAALQAARQAVVEKVAAGEAP
jgi:raffinose/stachyose/melibiose transport system substrate-binding protein